MNLSKRMLFVCLTFLVFLSGCLKHENTNRMSAEETGTTPLTASLEVYPKTVYSGEKLTAIVSLVPAEEKKIEEFLVCFYGSGIKSECKKILLLTGEKDIQIRFEAPSLPENVEETETLYARIFFKDDAMFSISLPVMERDEIIKKVRSGETLPSLQISAPSSFISLSVEVDKELPISVNHGKAEFEITLTFRNTGNGKIFDPYEVLLSSSEFPEITDEELNKAYFSIKAPSALHIECDREMVGDKYELEFFNGEDTVSCHAELDDPALGIEKVYPIFINVYYGYYLDLNTQYTVKGAGEFYPSPYYPEPDLNKVEIKIKFDKSCGKEGGSYSLLDSLGEIKCKEEEEIEELKDAIGKYCECITLKKECEEKFMEECKELAQKCSQPIDWYKDAIEKAKERIKEISERLKTLGCYWETKKFFVYRIIPSSTPNKIEVKYLTPAGGFTPYISTIEGKSGDIVLTEKDIIKFYHITSEKAVKVTYTTKDGKTYDVSLNKGYYVIFALPPKAGRENIAKVEVTVYCS